MLKKFLIFFVAFFIMVFLTEVILLKPDQGMYVILIKTFISGLVAAGAFVLITKKK